MLQAGRSAISYTDRVFADHGDRKNRKTTLVQEDVERLRGLPKKVDIISKTHCASHRAGDVTADRYVHRHILHGACTAGYLWIDETSPADIGLLCQLNDVHDKAPGSYSPAISTNSHRLSTNSTGLRLPRMPSRSRRSCTEWLAETG